MYIVDFAIIDFNIPVRFPLNVYSVWQAMSLSIVLLSLLLAEGMSQSRLLVRIDNCDRITKKVGEFRMWQNEWQVVI